MTENPCRNRVYLIAPPYCVSWGHRMWVGNAYELWMWIQTTITGAVFICDHLNWMEGLAELLRHTCEKRQLCITSHSGQLCSWKCWLDLYYLYYILYSMNEIFVIMMECTCVSAQLCDLIAKKEVDHWVCVRAENECTTSNKIREWNTRASRCSISSHGSFILNSLLNVTNYYYTPFVLVHINIHSYKQFIISR